MKKMLILVPIIVLIFVFLLLKKPTSPEPVKNTENIVGCYVAKIDKNIYTLNIQSQTDSNVSGTMHYDNFEFDDSFGSFNGKFENNILIGDYAFSAEGMNSIRELAWKYSGNNFIQGSGDYKTVNGREVFSNKESITWDPSRLFVKSACN